MILTVGIPTYNRNATLRKHLEMLLPQLTDECRVLILDNASPTPVAETLNDLISERVRVVRNPVNIGANANILRCFEMCETEWLWTLGDDDPLEPDAIASILGKIRAYPDCLYINFLAGGYDGLRHRDADVLLKGQKEFVDRVDSLANTFFISSGVHKMSAMREEIRFGHLYAHTQPNFIPFFVALGENGVCCLADAQVVTYAPPPDDQQWSVMNFALGIMAMLELPLAPDLRIALGRKILDSVHWHDMFLLQMLLLANKERDYRGALYLYDQLRSRIYYYDTNRVRRVKVFVYRTMVRFPFASYRLVRLLKGEKAKRHTLQSDLDRS